jgi:hypothetical protein
MSNAQNGLGAIERLDLALLVDARDPSAFRWVQAPTNSISTLLDQLRIRGQLEGLGAMQLDTELLPDSRDGRPAQASGCRHLPVLQCFASSSMDSSVLTIIAST